jgi:hypothetical protein
MLVDLAVCSNRIDSDGIHYSSAESAEQHSPGRKPWVGTRRQKSPGRAKPMAVPPFQDSIGNSFLTQGEGCCAAFTLGFAASRLRSGGIDGASINSIVTGHRAISLRAWIEAHAREGALETIHPSQGRLASIAFYSQFRSRWAICLSEFLKGIASPPCR